ncbi:MAG: bifunctional DNA-formamidopyrimidine glycosylase/DNA-(apurinic or apyrimidinic site) lyase [Erysipelothrix sp.]|nr:bifunctional DNA-formamidopyrimidine glycosylase/DNA-(apurinic or apyrimidinic site) lyase [Erysipelothrix sp.]
MPELPEVETVVRTLKKLVLNKEIESVDVYWDNIIATPQLEAFKQAVIGQKIIDISRRGKYIIFNLTSKTLISHLRMEGKYFVYDNDVKKDKHSHVIFKFSDNGQLHYNDTRKFGKMYLYDESEALKILANVGLEPWDKNLKATYLKRKAKNRRITIKQFLLDQSVISGIGNIYVNEILFLTNLHPETIVNTISTLKFNQIITTTQAVLQEAIDQGGTTIRSYTSSLGVSGLFQQSLNVHNLAGSPCPVCSSEIIKITVAQRGTYLCPSCQRKK